MSGTVQEHATQCRLNHTVQAQSDTELVHSTWPALASTWQGGAQSGDQLGCTIRRLWVRVCEWIPRLAWAGIYRAILVINLHQV